MKGDGTIDGEGNFQLGTGVVGTPELANSSVTSPKFSPTRGRVQATETALGEGVSEVAKLELTPAVDSVLLCLLDCVVVTTAETVVRMSIKYGGTTAAWHKEKLPVGERGMARSLYTGTLEAGVKTTVAMVMSRVGAGAATVKGQGEWQSGFAYMLVAA